MNNKQVIIIRETINESEIKLRKMKARLKFKKRRKRIINSKGWN